MPTTAIFGLLAAIAFVSVLGILSARSAARSRDSARSDIAAVNSLPSKERNKPKGAEDNPAMAMAGPTGANKPDSSSGPYSGS